jgi:hypothetical protein
MASPDTRVIARRITMGDSRSSADRGVELLDEAQAAFEDEARKHPEVDPKNIAQLLEFIHQRMGISPTVTTKSLEALGKLLGNRTAHTVEVMMSGTHGTTFGDQALAEHVRSLFAAASIAETEAERLAEVTGSDHRIPWDIETILGSHYDKATGFTVSEMFQYEMPLHAVAALRRTTVHNQELE